MSLLTHILWDIWGNFIGNCLNFIENIANFKGHQCLCKMKVLGTSESKRGQVSCF